MFKFFNDCRNWKYDFKIIIFRIILILLKLTGIADISLLTIILLPYILYMVIQLLPFNKKRYFKIKEK